MIWWFGLPALNATLKADIGFHSYSRSGWDLKRDLQLIGWVSFWRDSLYLSKPDTSQIKTPSIPQETLPPGLKPIQQDSLLGLPEKKEEPFPDVNDTLSLPDVSLLPEGGFIHPLPQLNLSGFSYDSTTGFALWRIQSFSGELIASGELEDYLRMRSYLADLNARRKGRVGLLAQKSQKRGEGLTIQVPVFTSPGARRIFGGSDVGLSVAGSITIEGGLTAERRNEITSGQRSPTNYALKVNQKQQFNIKGKVGEKVSVEVDQDSEKLFEFENSLRIRYKGEDDEIVKSVEAGNVDLNLRGSSLISASTQHKGLFGFKTQSQFGPLTLTTVASLDKGEKNEIEISAGARTARPVRILPTSYIQYRYYFLDYGYRENFRYYDENLNHVVTPLAPEILDIQVYRSVPIRAGENENAVPGWAFADTSERYRPGLQPDNRRVRANWLPLEPQVDYFVDRQLGYIRLTRPIDNQTALAVAYRNTRGVAGDLDPSDNNDDNPFVLKLLQPPNPQPSDPTWDLMWRHVYDLGSSTIDEENFQCRILFRSSEVPGEGQEVGIDATGRQRSYLAIFGLDQFSPSGPGEDGKVDGKFLNIPYGELHFPDLKPFDPEGWYKRVGGSPPELQPILLNPSERDSLIYQTPPTQLYTVQSDFVIEATYAASSATFDLGFGVLEGSEEVILNGQRLSRGTDYTVDYLSGQLTVLRKEALAPGADLKIRYERGQLFQLDTKTMLGLRADYDLGNNNFLGGTLLYLNQKTLDQRVRVGGEPLRNTVWGINGRFSVPFPGLTRFINALPVRKSDDPSQLSVEGEIAQVLPDPNSLNSPSTGDFNGVAYIDDFEAVKRSTPLGLTRRQWTLASFPLYDSRGSGRWLRQRGRVIWYEPDPVKVTDIWPERETQAQTSTISVLRVEYQPWWDRWGAPKPPEIDPTKSWGGIMRYLGAGFADQSQAKYLEIWLNAGSNRRGVIYIDIGRISEDIIPNGRLDSEDKPRPGFQTGNGILDPGEDVGLDGVSGADPADSVAINGPELPMVPSWDDYYYSLSDRYNYTRINGSEGNGSGNFLEGGNIPDTEDLNGNGYLDTYNDFYRYRIDLSDDQSRYIVGGKNNPKGWRLYRIPLTDTLLVGRPQFTQIEYVRLWFSEFREPAAITIAQMEIVGNEWREVKAVDEGGVAYDPVSVAVINTHDNPEYGSYQPPGVAGAIDPVTGLREKEQSLVIRVNRLGTGEIGTIYKGLPTGQAMNLTEYRRLKMFVRGGGLSGSLRDRRGREADLELFVRFGEDSSSRRPRYYEYSQKVRPLWSEIDVALDRFSALKFNREQDSTRNWDVLPDGAVIRVVGDPSLRNIRFWSIGIKNHGQPLTSLDDIEIWVDELRVSDIKRDPGWAASGSLTLKAAQLLQIQLGLRQQQADYHNLNQRVASDQSDRLSGNASLSLNLDQFFPAQWGIQLPLRGDFRQDVSVPKYRSNSDLPLTAIGGGGGDAWEIFTSTLWGRKRFSAEPQYSSPVDSLSSVRKSYALSLNYAKSGKSDYWINRLTLDRLRLGGNYSENWSSDWRDLYSYGYQKRANVAYDFSWEKPLEIFWLKWASGLPWIGPRVSGSKFRPLPTNITLNADGTETYDVRHSRSGAPLTPSYRFSLTRSYGLGWRPWDWWGSDWRRAVSSGRIPEDTTRVFIASRLARVDSSRFRVTTDSGSYFDSTGYRQALEREIDRIEGRLFWKLFGYYFVDNQISESYSFQFTPLLVSWLGTTSNYRSNYNWSWSSTYGPGDRSVSSNSNLSVNLTFRLPQLVGGWRRVQRGVELQKVPGMNGEDWLKKPSGKKLDAPSATPPQEGSASEATPDTVVQAGPKPPPAPLILLKDLISRMGDVSWNYSLTRDFRNNAVSEGQARLGYRLGFTRDPGLSTIPGFIFRNSFSTRHDHRFTTSLSLTERLSVSSIEYQITTSHNEGQQESGNFTRSVFPYFASDNRTIKTLPFVNYNVRWTGWERMPLLERLASAVSLDHSFRGEMSEQWIKVAPDSARKVLRIEYSKNYAPLIGINFSWRKGVGTSVRYNWQEQLSDERTGAGVKNKSLTSSITIQGSYTAQGGVRIPLVFLPTLRLQNQATFSLSYNNQLSRRESSAGTAPFTLSSLSSSWSLSPQVEYSFSQAVRGGFRYAYSVQRTLLTGRTRSQEFSFRINIIIRG